MSYDTSNIFAKILRGEIPCHKVYEDAHTLAFMDVMPQADGHTLVIPKSPSRNLLDADPAALGPLMASVQKVANAVRKAFDAEGILIQQFDGFALMSRTPYNDLMNVTFFEYGMDALPDYYSGLSFVTRRRLPEANRLTAIVMQRLPSDCSAWLSWARQCGSHPLDSVPSEILGALNRIPDRI
jgi:hypothetical protein